MGTGAPAGGDWAREGRRAACMALRSANAAFCPGRDSRQTEFWTVPAATDLLARLSADHLAIKPGGVSHFADIFGHGGGGSGSKPAIAQEHVHEGSGNPARLY